MVSIDMELPDSTPKQELFTWDEASLTMMSSAMVLRWPLSSQAMGMWPFFIRVKSYRSGIPEEFMWCGSLLTPEGGLAAMFYSNINKDGTQVVVFNV